MFTKSSSASSSSAETESLFSRTIFAPILFVSFLISLLIVDQKTSATILPHPDKKLHNEDHYYHSHQRKLAKREMDEAFALRKRVIAGMCLLSALTLVGLGWSLSKVWSIWNRNVHETVISHYHHGGVQ